IVRSSWRTARRLDSGGAVSTDGLHQIYDSAAALQRLGCIEGLWAHTHEAIGLGDRTLQASQ
ncbi:hypothetical protein, partial [Sphingomonas sanguinis]|uniref:hypothetical protein n=1 Tax=Sphingomonas sanguinis TaxID=33051 RepID=UPI0019CFFCE3